MSTTHMGGVPLVIFQHPCDRCHHTIQWTDGRPEPHECTTQEETP